MFHIFASLAEFGREITLERTKAELAAARSRGRKGGWSKGLSKKAQHTTRLAESLYKERGLSVKETCEQLSISRGTYDRYLKHRGVEVRK